MNWNAIAAVAELLAALGVVASLVYLVGTEFSHWSARYISRTSAEERETLALGIQVNAAFPFYHFFIENVPPNFYGREFGEFVRKSMYGDA